MNSDHIKLRYKPFFQKKVLIGILFIKAATTIEVIINCQLFDDLILSSASSMEKLNLTSLQTDRLQLYSIYNIYWELLLN